MTQLMAQSRPEKPETPRLLLTARDAAAALAISERKLWELTNGGVIKAVRIGRSVRYARAALEEFIAEQSV
jgi:excisionase family DNA binding protein